MWRRCGTTQNYFLAFTDELEKQILKPGLSLFYTCVPKFLMIWSKVPEI